MTIEAPPARARAPRAVPDRSFSRFGAVLSRWAPLAVAVLGATVVLARYGTPVPVTVWYLAFSVGTVVLPGALLWRLVRRVPGTLVEDAAAGAALGLALHVLLSLALAPAGLSGWAWLWSVLVVAATTTSPFRGVAWRRPSSTTSRISAWVQSGAVVASAVWLGATAFSRSTVAYLDGFGPWSRGAPATAYVDLPFHHAIAAGIESTFPFVYPYLYDEPLNYHYFVYLHLAGTSSASGIDLTWLLYRLVPLALTALSLVLVGALARRVSGRQAAAPLAAVLATFSGALSLYGWTSTPFQNPGILNFTTHRSPTQTFGTPIFLACVLAAVIVLRRPRGRASVPALAAFAVLAFAAAGSKSTFVPVLLCALLLVAAAGLVLRNRRWRLALVLTGITVLSLVFMTVVVLRGQSGSLTIAPLGLVRVFALTRASTDGTSDAHLALLGVLTVAAWLCTCAGAVLLARRRTLSDPALWLLIGLVVAGISGALLTTANGLSQLYFLYAAWPFLSVLTAWGLATSLPRRRPAWWAVACALGGGAVIAWAVGRLSLAPPAPVPGGFPFRAVLVPWAAFGAVVATVGVAVAVVLRVRRRPVRQITAVAVVCLLVGAALYPRAAAVLAAGAVSARGVSAPAPTDRGYGLLTDAGELSYNAYVPVPGDGARAALWVRDHAASSDVVATNAHCYGQGDQCESRHFWVSALTERRVLVEGWAYPEGFRPGLTRTSPFWDMDRYEANEAVFDDPSDAAVARLRDEWGVRWLVVDRTMGVESPELREHATLELELDDAAVYRIG